MITKMISIMTTFKASQCIILLSDWDIHSHVDLIFNMGVHNQAKIWVGSHAKKTCFPYGLFSAFCVQDLHYKYSMWHQTSLHGYKHVVQDIAWNQQDPNHAKQNKQTAHSLNISTR